MATTFPKLGRAALAVGILAVGLAAALVATRRDEPPAAPPAADLAEADPPAATTEPPAAAPRPPSFDLVRVAPDGSAVVAGRAAPNARVTIRTDDGALAEAEADAAGEFVAVFGAAPSADPKALTLESANPDGTRASSADVVILLPNAPGEPAPVGDPDAGPGPDAAPAAQGASEATAVDAADATQPDLRRPATAADADTGPGEPAAEVAVTVVLRDGVVEATPAAPAGERGRLTLASISYGESGLVTLAGFGDAGTRVRAYVDDRFARDGAVDAQGSWRLELGDVEAGVYRLRIDALRPDGTVQARIETPFQRDIPAPAGPAPQDGDRPPVVIVQPGANLWTLARIHYGAGVLYTQIYTANRDLIRDPELIYPGQIFVLPEPAPGD